MCVSTCQHVELYWAIFIKMVQGDTSGYQRDQNTQQLNLVGKNAEEYPIPQDKLFALNGLNVATIEITRNRCTRLFPFKCIRCKIQRIKTNYSALSTGVSFIVKFTQSREISE